MENEKVFDHEAGFNVVYKKKNSESINTVFIMSNSYRNAINKVLKIKGGFKKIDIISIQEFDRETMELRCKPVLADDVNGIIYKMKEEYKLSAEI